MRAWLRSPAMLLTGVVLVSAGLRYWGGTLVPSPWIAPDEFSHAELARDLYREGSFANFYGIVHPTLVGLPLNLADQERGYQVVKAVQAMVMSLTAVPAYLWARSLMSRNWALVAALLTLAVPGLAYSGLVMTEVVFYPAALLAAWAITRVLTRPTLARQAVAAAAILLAAGSRLQGIVLVPVLATAALFFAVLDRNPRVVLRLWPTAAVVATAAAAYAAWRLAPGGPASEVLGGYSDAAEVSYAVGDAARYVGWHAADVLLMTGLIPVCAFLLLLLGAVRGGEHSREAKAYVAVTAAVLVWFVLQVGVFASRHVEHLAERTLIAAFPLVFIGFALWLHRGAPRPRRSTIAIAVLSVALVASLPVATLVAPASLPDAFTLIPLWQLATAAPEAPLRAIVVVLATIAAVAFAFVPARMRWTLPAALCIGFAAVSVSATRVVGTQATVAKTQLLGSNPRWIDDAATGSVAFLYGREISWAAPYANRFWNRQINSVYHMPDAVIAGPIEQRAVTPLEDGRLVLADGSPMVASNVVVPRTIDMRGRLLAEAGPVAAKLWSVEQPVRIHQWVQLRSEPAGIRTMVVHAYGCRPGALRLTLLSQRVSQEVVIRQNGRIEQRVLLAAGQAWQGEVVGRPPSPVGSGLCTFQVDPAHDPIAEPIARYVPRSPSLRAGS